MSNKFHITYRPADLRVEMEPILAVFLEHYEIKGPARILVEPSSIVSRPGIHVGPAEKGSAIEEICVKGLPATGRLVKAGGDYVTLEIQAGQWCAINFNYREPLSRE